MRVLQLIDSLEPGGAERMAVNIANALNGKVEKSYLCASRSEGILKSLIGKNIGYLYLNKKNALDVLAWLRLYKFVKVNRINIIHAHSTSFFLATIIKFCSPNIKLVWHDHYGNSELLAQRNYKVLKYCSYFFSNIISVNTHLKIWAIEKLNCISVDYILNFISDDNNKPLCNLENPTSFKIVCVANLRPQKDHFTLLKAIKKLQNQHKNISLHIIGKLVDKKYSQEVLNFISAEKIDNIYIYGPQTGIVNLIKQGDIGVLSSISEGLPVALLEYGVSGLAVITTKVGECESVILDLGKTVAPKDSNALAEALLFYIENNLARHEDAKAFQKHIKTHYSQEAVLPKLIHIYTS